MNPKQRETAKMLRGMSSADAAEWLLTNCPLGAPKEDPILMLEHVPLAAKDTRKLAWYYLQPPVPARDRPCRVFAQLLGMRRLLKTLNAMPFENPRDAHLLRYHLSPIYKNVEDADIRALWNSFSDRLRKTVAESGGKL